MLAPAQLRIFSEFIQKETGIVYTESNSYQLLSRLEQISKALNLKNLQELYELAAKGIDGHLKQILLDLATNHETSFFRDPKIFSTIEKHILPEIRTQSPHLKLVRIWSAASSFGQEPYTLAMLINELLQRVPTHPRAEIVATDIAAKALARAKEGKFTQLEVQRGLPAPLLIKYFTKTEDEHWQIRSEIKLMAQFRLQNLLDSLVQLGSFELVLCRNVLIYQNEERKKDILKRIHDRISSRGFLILGASESLIGLSDQFTQRFENGTVFYQRKT